MNIGNHKSNRVALYMYENKIKHQGGIDICDINSILALVKGKNESVDSLLLQRIVTEEF